MSLRVSLCLPLLSPAIRCPLPYIPPRSPLACLPLATMSALLSATVPRNNCIGFVQDGVSQKWQARSPSCIAPSASCHAKRCTKKSLPPILRRPSPPPLALVALQILPHVIIPISALAAFQSGPNPSTQ